MKNKSLKTIFAPMLCLFLALASCSSDDGEPEQESETLVLSTNATTVFIDDEIEFDVKSQGQSIDATIYINDQAIQGNTHAFTEEGNYTIKAKKEGFSDSNVLNLVVIENEEIFKTAKKFQHKTLVEDITGAWCQYCPMFAYEIEKLETSDPEKFQAIAIHGMYDPRNTDPNYGGYDPYDFNPNARMAFENQLKVTGYPFAITDRKVNFRNDQTAPIDRHQPFSPIGIKINSKLGETSGSIDVGIRFGEDFTNKLNYAVFVLEDGLVFRQSNSTQYYRDAPFEWKNGWTLNYIHNNTLRGMSDGFRGKEIPAEFTVTGSEYVVQNIAINYASEDINKLKVVVIVTDAKTGEVLNTVVAKGNKKQNYQLVL